MNGKKVGLAIVLSGGLLVAVLYLGLSPSNLAAIAAASAISTWRARNQRRRDTAFWSRVWELRQAAAADRARKLAQVEPKKLRDRIAAILAEDGTNVASGDVEQFPFPLGLRRLASRQYWTMWVIALTMLGVAAFASVPLWLRCIPLVLSGTAAWGAWAATRRERSYDSIIEVTPFRVSELFPDGGLRTVLFNRYLELRHEPKHRRLRLTPSEHDLGIVLDFRRMGFDRMVDLIMEYGDFRPDDSERLPANER